MIFIFQTHPYRGVPNNMSKNTYNLPNFQAFATDVPRCSIPRLQGKSAGGNLTFDLKNSCSLELFKHVLNNWCYNKCPCQI